MLTFSVQKTCTSFLVPLKRFKSSVPVTMNVFVQKRNPLTGITEWDVQHEDYDYHQEIARSAFADMLHDTERNQKYQRALQLAIEKMHSVGKKAKVLDIGTGTGLLSIMAVRAGADSIVACEAFKPMAECCQTILKNNGVADHITLIPKRSTEITVGEDGDMKERANILVTEVFDTELIGEGALSTFTHAHKHLLDPDCIVVPDSAVIYAQVVECPMLQKWNKLNDLADEELQVVLRAPEKMRSCPGSAAVHDLQLSQIPRQHFTELSEPLAVFYYDWSGQSPLDKNRTVKQHFSALASGTAQAVFMWWDLNMDTEGKIVLSCAPWWAHPDADLVSSRPQDTIPWRDHWMQAVYYLPSSVNVKKDTELTLVSCQDEYSLWFYLVEEIVSQKYVRPICGCGVHMAFSRTHVSYLNDGRRSKKFLSRLREKLEEKKHPVVLDLNGSSFMGLAAAKMGANKVFILENSNLNLQILTDYIKENKIDNVQFISDVNDEVLAEVTTVICDPNLSTTILPWEDCKMAHILFRIRNKLRHGVDVIPERCTIKAMPVEFQDLHKIRIPLGICEGIDMRAFDGLVEKSREISDSELEAQPLWEYPAFCRGQPRTLMTLDLDLEGLPRVSSQGEEHQIWEEDVGDIHINGFVVWTEWSTGVAGVAGGEYGELVACDPHTRQAVKIFKRTHIMKNTDAWSYQVVCDLETGQFDLKLDLVPKMDED